MSKANVELLEILFAAAADDDGEKDTAGRRRSDLYFAGHCHYSSYSSSAL